MCLWCIVITILYYYHCYYYIIYIYILWVLLWLLLWGAAMCHGCFAPRTRMLHRKDLGNGPGYYIVRTTYFVRARILHRKDYIFRKGQARYYIVRTTYFVRTRILHRKDFQGPLFWGPPHYDIKSYCLALFGKMPPQALDNDKTTDN